uniref:Uncharacterized protein n=1 Tax=viral metagenome TaxID=1070528 RepID=A0A6M3LRN9_9ZZZZ
MDRQKQILKSDARLKLFEGDRVRQHKPITNYEVDGEKVIIPHDEFTRVGHNDFAQLFEHICKRLSD